MIVNKLTEYHVKYREWLQKSGEDTPRCIGLHNIAHYGLVPIMTILRKFRRQRLVVFRREKSPIHASVIYACTHIGGFDIENLFEAIKDPCYLFLADPREVYLNVDGLFLWLNGVICFESDKKDKTFAKQRAINLLKAGGSLMIFPEGAWNIYDNLPIMPLFWGTADIAISAKADIIPVAIERYDDEYCVNIGRRIRVTSTEMDKVQLTEQLSERLASLKWDLWERKGIYKRKNIVDMREQFLEGMFGDKKTSVSIEDVLRTRFYPSKAER